jgi:hypothetical protein
MVSKTDMQCIVCHRDLENDDPRPGTNQPIKGLAFFTSGHRPSTVLDGADGTNIEINVCDGCLEKAADAGRVLEQLPRVGCGGFWPPETFKPWVFPKGRADIAEQYKAAEAFDASMTPQHKATYARSVRQAWLESGGTEETFRLNFPQTAAEIDADIPEDE